MAVEALFNLSNPVFVSYAFYAVVVLIKMMLMSQLTAVKRVSNKAFSSPEDASYFSGGKLGVKTIEEVERVRRNHLNDVENIPAFLFLGLLYVTIQPNPATALWHFRVFAISRVLHTLVYQLAVPQPARGLAFSIGVATCGSMAVQILMARMF